MKFGSAETSANQQVTAVDLPDGTTAVNGAADTAKRQPQFILLPRISVFDMQTEALWRAESFVRK
jgi:hypothetical protein